MFYQKITNLGILVGGNRQVIEIIVARPVGPMVGWGLGSGLKEFEGVGDVDISGRIGCGGCLVQCRDRIGRLLIEVCIGGLRVLVDDIKHICVSLIAIVEPEWVGCVRPWRSAIGWTEQLI